MPKMSSIDKSLYCDVCNTLYKTEQESRNSNSRLPLLLKCGHTLCENCIRVALKNGKSSITCQQCQIVTDVDADDSLVRSLPIDFHVLGLSAVKKSNLGGVSFGRVGAIIKNQAQDQVGAKGDAELCSECCRVEATVTCVKCESNVCKKCFDKIHQAKVLRKHKAIPLQRDDDEANCAVHSDRPVEYYCDDDDTVICSRCYIVGDHMNHTITPLEEKNKSVQATLEPAIDSASKFVRKAGQTIKVLNSLTPEWRSELDKKILEVRGQFHAMHSQLQLREQEMVAEVEKAFSESTIPLMSIKRDLEHDLVAYERLVSTARRLRTGTDSRANAAQVLNQLLKVNDRPCAVEAPPKIQTDLGFDFDISQMKAAIGKFGQIEIPEKEKCYRLLTLSECPDVDDDDVESVASSTVASVIIEDTTSDVASVTSSTEDGSMSGSRGKRRSRGRGRLRSRDDVTDDDVKPVPQKILKRKTLTPATFDHYRNETVTVCHIKNPCNFLVHMMTAKHKLDLMGNDINRWCKSVDGKKTPSKVEVDGLYLGQFSADKRWYRCRVKSLTEADGEEDMAFVHYVDFGNSETIRISNLREMPTRFFREAEFAVRCSLVDIVPVGGREWTEQANNNFARMTGEQPMHLIVIDHSPDTLFVDLSRPPCNDITNDQPISVRDALVFLELACFSSPHSIGRRSSIKERQFHAKPIPEAGDRINGFVCHVDSPDSFYIQTVDEEVAYLSTMSQEIQIKYSFDKNDLWTIFCPMVGMICVARMPSDDCWYRAQVTSLPGGRMVQVFYVDYGNSEVVSIWDLKKITDEFMILTPQAIKCALADVKPLDGRDWSQHAVVEFSSAALHKLYVFDVKERIDENTISVIAQDGLENKEFNLNVWFIDSGHGFSSGSGSIARKFSATRGKPKEKTDRPASAIQLGKSEHFARPGQKNALQRLADKEKLDIELCIVSEETDGQFYPATVSRLVSPGEIYIQSTADAKDILEKLKTDLLEEYGTSEFEKDMVWLPGLNVAVYCEENESWYRATILEITDDDAKIRLLDYGDEQTVKIMCLRLLKSELVAQPCQALKCHLDGVQPAGGSQWSATSKDLISEAILPPKQCKVLKTGDVVNDSTPVDLLAKEIIPADALNASKIELISVSKLLIEKGVALPIKAMSPKLIKKIDLEEEAKVESKADLNTKAQKLKKRVVERSTSCRANERTTYPPMIPPEKNVLIVVPTYLDYDCILYVQDMVAHSDALDLIMDDLKAIFDDSEVEFDAVWKIGQAVTAHFSEDQQWYRGIIHDIDKKGILVHYVDFGNRAYVHPSRLRSDIYHMTVPRLCYPCIIKGLETSSGDGVWPLASLNYMHNLVVAHTSVIEILEKPEIDQPLVVKLTMENECDFLEHLIENGHALAPMESGPMDSSVKKSETVKIEQKTENKVIPESDIEVDVKVEATVSGLERTCLLAESVESDDGIKVTADARSRSADAYLSESGHSGHSDSSAGEGKTPKRKSRAIPVQEDRKSWSEIVDESVLGDSFVELVPRDSDYSEIRAPGNGLFAQYAITTFIEPSVFFAQRTICSDESEESMKVNCQLNSLVQIIGNLSIEADSLKKLSPRTVRVGQACCARFSFDQCWYRAEIIHIQEQYYTILFVDYGNKEVQFVEDLRILPEKYLGLPAQALMMKISGIAPGTGEYWSPAALEGMTMLGQSKHCIVKTVDKDVWPPLVELYESVPLMGEEGTLYYQELVDEGLVKKIQ